MIRVALIGAGAIGERHLLAFRRIPEAEIAAVISASLAEAAKLASIFAISDTSENIEAVLERPDIDAVILATPTQLHASQAMQCLAAGKHVLIEIPIADNAEHAEALLALSKETQKVCMAAHTSRFYPSHAYLHGLIEARQFKLQQMNVQTHFLRRSNLNAKGEPRSWTDHLLWHHAAHTIDLFRWQSDPVVEAQVMQGPIHSKLGIAMDMSVQLKSGSGAICSLSLSFNNDGPIGSTVRYIGDTGTYVARRRGLEDGYGEAIRPGAWDIAGDGVESQDREFVASIVDERLATSSVGDVADCYRVIGELAEMLKRT